MPRPRTKVLTQCWEMVKENEAVWAVLAVLALTIFVEFYL